LFFPQSRGAGVPLEPRQLRSNIFVVTRIVVLDGYALNPGDLSWDDLRALGETELHDRTPEAAARR
jgi:hypothetical protein